MLHHQTSKSLEKKKLKARNHVVETVEISKYAIGRSGTSRAPFVMRAGRVIRDDGDDVDGQ